ncbi:MAG: hypothetical protein JW862_03555 [Anaerolineales bacterium]|nr:hypothetical protein [Anaerolineales bacterium]
MARSNRELWLAFIAIVFITLAYLLVLSQLGEVPAASDFYGHMLGVLGFVLMLMTEILYSLRKRSRSARWGRMADWLRFHIFTGLVGPYLVLLHSAWKFNGLAGLVLLLTILIVVSGVIGRYIYTAVPRTADGVVMEAAQLSAQIAQAEAQLQDLIKAEPELFDQLPAGLVAAWQPENSKAAAGLVLGRGWQKWRWRWRWVIFKRQASPRVRQRLGQLEDLLIQRQTLRRQIASLAVARRLLALWHSVHIPLGFLLFSTAFVHVVAAFYYATLLR